jgi:hypothetical protein
LTAQRIFGIFELVKLLGAHGDATYRTNCSWQFAAMSLVAAMTTICGGKRDPHGHAHDTAHDTARGNGRDKERIE